MLSRVKMNSKNVTNACVRRARPPDTRYLFINSFILLLFTTLGIVKLG